MNPPRKINRDVVWGFILVICLTLFVFGIVRATAPDPGHNYTEASGGVVQGNMLYGSATDVLSALTKDTNATRYLSNTGTSNNPAWAQINLANGVTGTLADGNIASALTGKTINAVTITAQAVGFTVAGGSTSKTLTVTGDATISGTPPSVGVANTWTALNTFTTGVSVSSNFEVTGNNRLGINAGGTTNTTLEVGGAASASQYFGLALSNMTGTTGCSGTTADKLLYNSTTGVFSCGTDQTGGGSGSSFPGIEVAEGTGLSTHFGSVSFDPGMFNISAGPTASSTYVRLDWTNGPASRAAANQWNNLNIFAAGASVSTNLEVTGNNRLGINAGGSTDTTLEVGGIASISSMIISGALNVAPSNVAIVGYSRFGSTVTTHGLTAASDLLISGKISVDSQAFFDSAASVATNFEVKGIASASKYFGIALSNMTGTTGCSGTTADKLLYNSTTGVFSCGTDQTGGGGGSFNGLLAHETAGATTPHITDLTFDAGMFNFTNTASAGTLKLDWVNGPASRAAANTWTNTQIYSYAVTLNGGAVFPVDVGPSFGNNSIAALSVMTPDALEILSGVTANSVHVLEVGDSSFDFNNGPCGTSTCADPTFIIHSHNQTTTQWISLTHDATNGILDVGTGRVSIPDGMIAANASISTNFEVLGIASASKYFGIALSNMTGTTGCSGTTADKLLYNSTTGVFSCGTDQTGGGGGSFNGLLAHETAGATTPHITDLTFDAGMFNFTNTASAGTLKLDWVNGPASRAAANQWNNLNIFAAGASVSTNLEVTGDKRLGINAGGSTDTTLEVGGIASVSGDLYVNGNMGVGTMAPGQVLEVLKTQNAVTGLRISNLSAISGADAELQFFTDCSLCAKLTKNNSTNTTYGGAGSLNLVNINGASLTLATNDTVRVTVKGQSGYVGIGTQTPLTKLDVWQGTASASRMIVSEALNAALANVATVSYSRFGTSTTTHGLTAASDLLISGRLSIDSQAFFDSAASVATNFEVLGYASASKYFGASLASCTGTSFLQWSAGLFGCATPAGGGSGSSFPGIEVAEGTGLSTHFGSVSFDAGMFNIGAGATASSTYVRLDWTNGPASRAAANQWNNLNIFAAGASVSTNLEVTGNNRLGINAGNFTNTTLEVGGIASVSSMIVAGALNVAPANAAIVAYSRIGASVTTHGLTAASDLLLSGQLSVDSQAFFDSAASVASNFEVRGIASASKYFGIALTGMTGTTGCSGTVADKLLYNSTTGVFSCGTDQTSALSASISTNFEITTNSRLGINSGGVTDTTLEVGGIASISGALNVGGAVVFLSTGNLSAAAITLGVLSGALDCGGCTSFEIPNAAAMPTLDAAGEVGVTTSSVSLGFFDGTNVRRLRGKDCYTFAYETPTKTDDWGYLRFDDPFTIEDVTLVASGTNAVGWNMRHGVAGTNTNLFTADKSASTSTGRFYNAGFNDATLDNGDKLTLRITSASAMIEDINITVCGRY